MAFPTAVNSQITDSVTQVNTEVLGEGPAVATGNLFVATSQALANAAHNATTNQQLATTSQQATTTIGVTNIFSLGASSSGEATSKVFA